MWTGEPQHVPVLLDQVIAALHLDVGHVVVDGTFGGGGYSRALLNTPASRVVGIDRDPDAVARGRELAAVEPRFTMQMGSFSRMTELLAGLGLQRVDRIVLDLGVSSFQLDQSERGFSFQRPGPLDMRMSQEGASAAELLATVPEADLVRILRELGDEPDARAVARAIVRRRAARPITRTDELAELVAKAKGGRRGPRDPATRTFQALRMWVNDELGELDRVLEAAEALLADEGVLAVVSFHSGEDERVKRFIDQRGGREVGGSRHLPPRQLSRPRWMWRERRIIRPSDAELAVNPRARSAKLRVAVRRRDPEEASPDESGTGWRLAA
jgi:16S rRNA (cytosine1402-N4)-methyltransferase